MKKNESMITFRDQGTRASHDRMRKELTQLIESAPEGEQRAVILFYFILFYINFIHKKQSINK